MRRFIWLFIGAALLAGALVFIQPYWSGISPAFLGRREAQEHIEKIAMSGGTDFGEYEIADGYTLSIISTDLSGPRVLAFDQKGRLLVSEPSEGRVSLLDPRKHYERRTLIDDLDSPHGIAFHNGDLYVAETGQIQRFAYDQDRGTTDSGQVILDLPTGGLHSTRTIGFGPYDGDMYISVGSTCNICEEEDWRRTKILRYDLEEQRLTTYASGLRNAVFFRWRPSDGLLYATEMGRDFLSDDVPPDELNLVSDGNDYGFPYCYGENVTDPEFNRADKCRSAEGPLYEFQAHEAPLGLDFLPSGDMLVALHGSWNREEPVGYKVIRLTAESGYQTRDTFLGGFLRDDHTAIGRPADILVATDGSVYISDDKADAIYRLQP